MMRVYSLDVERIFIECVVQAKRLRIKNEILFLETMKYCRIDLTVNID